MIPVVRIAVTALCLAVLPAMASAQPETGVTAAADGTRTSYGPEFFEGFDAVSAEDILRRIPGIQHLLKDSSTLTPAGGQDEERRGFGSSGDQILIDGQRLSGKSNDITTALKNIQARQVARVEVIHGAAAGLDVRSEGLIVNVVLRQVAGSGAWEANAVHRTKGGVGYGGRASYAGRLAGWKYTAAVQVTPYYQLRDRVETFSTPAGVPFEIQNEVNQIEDTDLKLTLNTSTVTAGGTHLNLNGSYTDIGRPEVLPVERFAIAGATRTFLGTESRQRTHAEDTWEVGGDIEVPLSGGQARVLFVGNDTNLDLGTTLDVAAAGQSNTRLFAQTETQAKSERIVRGSYASSGRVGFDLGAEVAVNTLEKSVAQSSNQGGVLRPVNLFNAQSKIRETRIEPFAGVNWQAAPDIFVDGALEYERSNLKQTGRDVNNRRRLGYIKPSLDVRYDVSPTTQFRLGAIRTVSQLDFATFVSSFETDDNSTGVVNAGNPNIVPEKAWEYALTAEQRLAGDGGLVSVKGYYDDITDHIEVIPVGDGSVVAPGNIGAAREYGAELKGSLRLDRLGVAGGVVETNVLARKTRATDPFTGEKRRILDLTDYTWSVRFRQDFAWHNLSYGVTLEDESIRDGFDISYSHRFSRKPDFQAFIELQPVAGLTARLEGVRLLQAGAERRRLTYLGNRGRGLLIRREFRDIKFSRDIKLSLRGAF